MNHVSNKRWEELAEIALPTATDLGPVIEEICEKALNDAKAQLHPLIQSAELDRLDKRGEFVQAFKSALENRIARRLVVWYPGIQAVFKFDETLAANRGAWDGSIHLLVKIPRLSNTVRALGKKLDRSLTKYLNQLGWSRFRKHRSILEIQQVTPNELRHGVSYGAMFCSVYNAPVKVWSSKRQG